MGQEYLIDTNVIIDYLGNRLSTNGTSLIDSLSPVISIITKIELLGWYGATSKQIARLLPFVNDASIYFLNEPIVEQTIRLRQDYKIKTPDAIIAATALVYNLKLLSRNEADFKKVNGLITINPNIA